MKTLVTELLACLKGTYPDAEVEELVNRISAMEFADDLSGQPELMVKLSWCAEAMTKGLRDRFYREKTIHKLYTQYCFNMSSSEEFNRCRHIIESHQRLTFEVLYTLMKFTEVSNILTEQRMPLHAADYLGAVFALITINRILAVHHPPGPLPVEEEIMTSERDLYLHQLRWLLHVYENLTTFSMRRIDLLICMQRVEVASTIMIKSRTEPWKELTAVEVLRYVPNPATIADAFPQLAAAISDIHKYKDVIATIKDKLEEFA